MNSQTYDEWLEEEKKKKDEYDPSLEEVEAALNRQRKRYKFKSKSKVQNL
tara:strand:- start:459 stop:608 length:150 start_codon:yes stop_codon:yes gene_type:complete